ncbi:hypothetical protein D3C74_413270 [compost metagenome]
MGNRVLIDHLALADYADGIGHLLNFTQQVTRYQHGNPLLTGKPFNQRTDLLNP